MFSDKTFLVILISWSEIDKYPIKMIIIELCDATFSKPLRSFFWFIDIVYAKFCRMEFCEIRCPIIRCCADLIWFDYSIVWTFEKQGVRARKWVKIYNHVQIRRNIVERNSKNFAISVLWKMGK